MPTASFVKAKKIGRWFESLVDPVLLEKGFEIVDTDEWSYRDKKGVDRVVKINGQRCNLEMKFDAMSEQTGNICIEELAVQQSNSPIWVYGLPSGSRIDLYTMYLSDLATYVASYPIKRPVGEYGLMAALVRKDEFISQPFVKKWKTINLN